MVTITTVPQSKRIQPDIILPVDSISKIESVLQFILNNKFDNILKIIRLSNLNDANKIWIVSSADPDYLFGFKIILCNNRLQVKGGINTWSMWAEDYMRQNLIEMLNGTFSDKSMNTGVYTNFEDFNDWMKKYKITTDVSKLPSQFKRIAHIH